MFTGRSPPSRSRTDPAVRQRLRIPATTIKRFALDEDATRVIDYRRFDLGDRFSAFCGDVRQIDDDHMIGWGMAGDGRIATAYDFRRDRIVSEIISSSTRTYRTQYYE